MKTMVVSKSYDRFATTHIHPVVRQQLPYAVTEHGQHWRFSIAAYHGAFQIFVRASLAYIAPTDAPKEKILYSNVIPAGINPAHFWNKQAYMPVGTMDPYNQ